jgi:hypothetical protein
MVVTDFSLGDILHNRDATGRISKWAVELKALNIDFTSRKAINSQALTNFIAEWTDLQQHTLDAILDHWKMCFDGSLKLGGPTLVSSSYLQMKNNSNMLFKSSSKL